MRYKQRGSREGWYSLGGMSRRATPRHTTPTANVRQEGTLLVLTGVELHNTGNLQILNSYQDQVLRFGHKRIYFNNSEGMGSEIVKHQ